MRGLQHLHPYAREKAEKLEELCQARGLPLLITETFRTKEEQESLYALGRSKPGKIVTYARGDTYSSAHQWGVAFDFCKNVRGQEYSDKAFFNAVGALGKSIGLFWGGDFRNFVDTPHFELPEYMPGNTTSMLRQKYTLPDNFKKTWKEAVMVTKTEILVNGKLLEIERILKDDRNYVQLNALASALDIKLEYDEARKLPVIHTGQAN